ncbi:MAG: hypothetical protein V2A54_04075 [Bacteroidota bacterium]|jgi:hypothetical protein
MNEDPNTEKFESGNTNFRSKNPFQVPDGYFENLPSEIQNRIVNTQSKRRVPAIFRPAYFVPVLAVLILALIFLRPKQTTTNPALSSTQDYSEFITEYYDELGIDDNTIMEAYMDEVQDTIKNKKNLNDSSKINYNMIVPFNPEDTTLSDEDIMEYLIEQGFEENPEL